MAGEARLSCLLADPFLLRFLRAKKFDYERAYKMIQRYCAMRSRAPAYFNQVGRRNLNFTNFISWLVLQAVPSLAGPVLDCQLQTVLPHRDQQAR